MASIEDYKCEHLFLLIGRNPLPNYVAAKLLTKLKVADSKAHLYLLHSEDSGRSKGTKNYADNLTRVLGSENVHTEFLPVEPSNPTSIATEIDKHLLRIPANEAIGLNYTGGTKAMAVHAYGAIRQWKERENEDKKPEDKRKVFFSYLDPRQLTLWIDPVELGGHSVPFNLGCTDPPDQKRLFDDARISFEQLLKLHGQELLPRGYRNPRSAPVVEDVVNALWADYDAFNTDELKKWREWKEETLKPIVEECQRVGGSGGDKDVKGRQLTEEEWAEYSRRLRNKRISFTFPYAPKLRCALEKLGLLVNDEIILENYPNDGAEDTVGHFCKGIFNNTWLEDYVFHQVQMLATQCNLHDVGISLGTLLPKETEPYFEIDVIAMRGYQLFAVSCTLNPHRQSCKEKLFEIKLRAEQLGGEEARIGLVCRVGKGNPRELSILRKQLESDNIKVFGYSDLPDLANGLEKWFKGEI